MIFVYPNTLSTFTGKRETAINAGYVEVEETVYEELCEGKKKWQDGEIVVNEDYKPEEATIEEIPFSAKVEKLIRAKYSISDEISILRQRDTKPEQFAEYNAYCEDCKTKAREEK